MRSKTRLHRNRMSDLNKYTKDIETLTGLHYDIARDYLQLYQTLVLHYLSEQANDASELLKEFDMELPGIGVIHFKWNSRNKMFDYDIKLGKIFIEKVNKVRKTGESPLPEQIELGLMAKINKDYDGSF